MILKHLVAILGCAVLTASIAAARETAPLEAYGKLPEVGLVALSPDGGRLALLRNEGEQSNLADSKPNVVDELERSYQDWRKGMADPAWPSKPRRQKISVDGMIYELNI